jgi:peptidyl-prolyl cis-trans isomerase SDCCAG10
MSSIYVHEPPTAGKVVLTTTFGEIEIELWSKECPKACRSFVQLCLERYYDNVIFHRIIPAFMIQTGDPTGSGTGGESAYGEGFADEVHSRLGFRHRGMVAMANSGKPCTNGSQFFILIGDRRASSLELLRRTD